MAKNFNVTSATFDGVAMAAPQHVRAALTGTTKPNSSGVETHVSGLKLAERRVMLEVFFNDSTSAISMLAKHGTDATLVLVWPKADGTGNQTATVTHAVCTDVNMAAEHAEWGLHSAMFEAYASDGATNPISVA